LSFLFPPVKPDLFLKRPAFPAHKKTEKADVGIFRKRQATIFFLRWHYPHQVKGSKFDYFLSARLRAPPDFFLYCIIAYSVCQRYGTEKTPAPP